MVRKASLSITFCATFCATLTACFDWEHVGRLTGDGGFPIDSMVTPVPVGLEGSIPGDYRCPIPHLLVPVAGARGLREIWRFAPIQAVGSSVPWQACPQLPVWGPNTDTVVHPLDAVAGVGNVVVVGLLDGVTTLTMGSRNISGKFQRFLSQNDSIAQLFPMRLSAEVGTPAQQETRFGLTFRDGMASQGTLAALTLLDGTGTVIETTRINGNTLVPTALRMGAFVTSLTSDANDRTRAIGTRMDRVVVAGGGWGSMGTMLVTQAMPINFTSIGSAASTDGTPNIAMTNYSQSGGIYYPPDHMDLPVRCSPCREFISAIPHPTERGEYLMECKTTDGFSLFHYRGDPTTCHTVKSWIISSRMGQMSIVTE